MNPYNGYDHNQRMAAYRWLMKEYASGVRVKPTKCDACQQTNGVIEPHSEDYSAPYGDHIGQYGLCYRCHMMIHCRFKNKLGWNKYLKLLRDGYNFDGMTKNYHGFIYWLQNIDKWIPIKANDATQHTVLDFINKE